MPRIGGDDVDFLVRTKRAFDYDYDLWSGRCKQ